MLKKILISLVAIVPFSGFATEEVKKASIEAQGLTENCTEITASQLKGGYLVDLPAGVASTKSNGFEFLCDVLFTVTVPKGYQLAGDIVVSGEAELERKLPGEMGRLSLEVYPDFDEYLFSNLSNHTQILTSGVIPNHLVSGCENPATSEISIMLAGQIHNGRDLPEGKITGRKMFVALPDLTPCQN